VEEDGHLRITDEKGTVRRYAFKEVKYKMEGEFRV
jgi:hypothetical protein